jgi:hypothetical protein
MSWAVLEVLWAGLWVLGFDPGRPDEVLWCPSDKRDKWDKMEGETMFGKREEGREGTRMDEPA